MKLYNIANITHVWFSLVWELIVDEIALSVERGRPPFSKRRRHAAGQPARVVALGQSPVAAWRVRAAVVSTSRAHARE
jgi:hypothetical protein